MRILAVAVVGSHLETIFAIEKTLRSLNRDIHLTIADLVGFTKWNCRQIPYLGAAERVEFSPRICGIGERRIDLLTWHTIKKGADRLFDKLHPDLLLIIDDSWYGEYALLSAAQRRHCPSLLIQEGPFRQGILPLQNDHFNIIHKAKKYVRTSLQLLKGKIPAPQMPYYGSGGATCIAVASSHYASLFQSAGVPSKRIHVTGIPRYDKLAQLREKHSIHTNTIGSGEKSKILLIHQPFVRYGELTPSQYDRACEITASGMNQILARGNSSLTIRLHPSDIEADIAPLMNRLSSAIHIQKAETPLIDEIWKYDLVIGFYLSALLEALALDIPVVTVDVGIKDSRQLWFQNAGVPVTRKSNDFASFVEIGLSKTAHVQTKITTLTDEIGEVDGCAGARIVALIEKLVFKRHTIKA